MNEKEALKLALSTLNEVRSETFRLMRNGQTLYAEKKVWDTITAIKEVLAQPEQEPVEVFLTDEHQMGFKVGVQSFILDYWPDLQSEVEFMKTQLLTAFARAAPPQRKPLTDEEIDKAWRSCDYTVPWEQHRIDIARAIEAAHGIKENT